MLVKTAIRRADRIADERINLLGPDIEFWQRRSVATLRNEQRACAFDMGLLRLGNQQDRNPFDHGVAVSARADQMCPINTQLLLVARTDQHFIEARLQTTSLSPSRRTSRECSIGLLFRIDLLHITCSSLRLFPRHPTDSFAGQLPILPTLQVNRPA